MKKIIAVLCLIIVLLLFIQWRPNYLTTGNEFYTRFPEGYTVTYYPLTDKEINIVQTSNLNYYSTSSAAPLILIKDKSNKLIDSYTPSFVISDKAYTDSSTRYVIPELEDVYNKDRTTITTHWQIYFLGSDGLKGRIVFKDQQEPKSDLSGTTEHTYLKLIDNNTKKELRFPVEQLVSTN